jgi:hypothetical protein
MESTADTGTRIETPEGSLISIGSLFGSEVWTRKKVLCEGGAASLRFHW